MRPLYTLPLLTLAVLTGCRQGGASRPDDLELSDGDLLFTLNAEGSHITDVTVGIDALPVEHVGIYVSATALARHHHVVEQRQQRLMAAAGGGEGGSLWLDMPTVGEEAYVLEAIPDSGVTLTPLVAFMARSTGADGLPLVLVGRMTSADFDADLSLQNALGYLGTPYDSLFMPDDREIYCSELVQKSYVNRLGNALLQPIPMSFRDASGEITPHWERFYTRLGLVVPDGEPGSNPGELSRRSAVQIIGRMF